VQPGADGTHNRRAFVPTNLTISAAVAAFALSAAAVEAADVAQGKAVAQAQCVQCHEADDWDGEDAASLESLIRDIVAAKVKHKTKLDLTPAQIAAIAAYWEESSRKR
jgi:mono/diheme cytochrome c family protein